MIEKIKQKLIDKLNDVENGEIIEMYIPYGIAEDILENNGFEIIKELDTNGYQIDYWVTFSKNNIDYKVSGDMYYGSFIMTKQ